MRATSAIRVIMVAGLIGFRSPSFSQQVQIPSSDTAAAVTSWVRSHAVPLTAGGGTGDDNLEKFASIIGSANVIGLGEPAHGIHEFLILRNHLFRYLVEQAGVTAIAAETGFTESLAVEDCILGRRELTDTVVGSVFSWSAGVSYAENRSLLEWMREYNARSTTKRKLHFYGIDLTGGRQGRFAEARLALDAAIAYLPAVDSMAAREFSQRLAPYLPYFSSSRHDSLSPTQRDALSAGIGDLIALFERRQTTWTARTSTEAYTRAYHQAVVSRQLEMNFRAAAAESNPQAQREGAMAQNLKWALDCEGTGGRVFLYEANWHLSKGPMVTDRWGSSLGELLQTQLGKGYVAVGSVYGRAQAASPEDAPFAPPEAGSVAALISGLELPECLLNLQSVPRDNPVRAWFRAQRALMGGRVDKMAVGDAFDALVYVQAISPAHGT